MRLLFSLPEKSPNHLVCLEAPCTQTGQRTVPLKSSSLHVCQLWVSNRIESSLDRLGGMNVSVSGLKCFTDTAKDKCLNFPANKSELEIFFC